MTRTGIAATAACPELGADDVVDDVVKGVDEVGAERVRDVDPDMAARARDRVCLGTGLLRLITSESLGIAPKAPDGPKIGPGL